MPKKEKTNRLLADEFGYYFFDRAKAREREGAKRNRAGTARKPRREKAKAREREEAERNRASTARKP